MATSSLAAQGCFLATRTAPSRRTVIASAAVARQQQDLQQQRQQAPPEATAAELGRRGLLSAAAAVVFTAAAGAPAALAEPVPPPPAVGDCVECQGLVNETLNACNLESASCISTLNDDAEHFEAPWEFDGDRATAVARLIEVATGGDYEQGLIGSFGGIRQTDAAAYIAKGVLAVATGGDMPAQPERRRKSRSEFRPFDGTVVERRTSEGGAEYVRIVLGTSGGAATDVDDPSDVVDCEFLFLSGDNLVNVRAASRAEPAEGLGANGKLAISFTDGFVVDRNVARRRMDALRTALRWEVAPVIADFSPAFNAEAPTVFDRIFDPYGRRASFQPSGTAYPVEGERRIVSTTSR